MSPDSPLSILKKYWGYDSFREMQLPIIESVLNGNDTLGLLPTGGGKSLTFQIPALLMPGLTLVVTPLISLMKDQVDNLRSRGVRAVAIHSGLSRSEHRLALDRCRLGKAKMLYLSPEKLQSESFITHLCRLDVSMIVVDEAHCISQWGYDFRPSYLHIAALRRHFPDAVMLALTASATPEVRTDIMDRLKFRSRTVFSKSFARPNISYLVRYADHKPGMLLKVLKATSGSAIVYVRSRKRCREIAGMLRDENISADYYHAGLVPEEKNEKQNRWKAGEVRVMVATNAFGMGIDKPDVRVVVHIDPPSSLEEYYQEAGRAGRDGLPSFAVMIVSGQDKGVLTRRLNEAFPEKDTIRRVYELACNFLEVAVGSGFGQLYEFNFPLFCERFGLRPVVVRNALAILTNAGYVEYVEEITTRSRVMIVMDKRGLYEASLEGDADEVLQLILRTYTGLFADYVDISEELIGSRLNIPAERVYKALLELGRLHVLNYIPRKTTPYLFFPTSRELPRHVGFPRAVYEEMRRRMEIRINAMKEFLFSTEKCRGNMILRYFGEHPETACGTCDVCRERRKNSRGPRHDEASLSREIKRIAAQPAPTSVGYIASQLGVRLTELVPVLRSLMDEGEIRLEGDIVVASMKD